MRPHRQQSIIRRINQKLSTRFYGPFPIITRVGPVAYKLQLPESACIHPVFHVSLLKKVVGTATVVPELPLGLLGDTNEEKCPMHWLAKRMITKEGGQVEQWLIQWT